MMAISKCINIKVVALLLFAVAVLAACVANNVLVKSVKKSNNKTENKSRRRLADRGHDDELYNALSDDDKALVDKILAEEEWAFQLLGQTDDDDLFHNIDGVSDEGNARHLMSFLKPLSCNDGVDFDALACTALSSLLPSTSTLEVGCGTCVTVDITDGSTVELPNGLRVSGMLHFGPTANVVIRTTSVLVEGILKIETPASGNQVKFMMYGQESVTYTSREAGSRCESGCNLGSKPIAVVGGQLDIKGYLESCPSWEKLIAVSSTALNELTVSPEAAACWGPGTELVITSHTRSMEDRQVVTVVSSDTTTGKVVLAETIAKPITLEDSLEFAVEIASLTRPVVFEGEVDDSVGGHLIVFHTQTPQHIEGVEIRHFGQQGILGKYPVHFHGCHDSPGSIVKNNVVRESLQRGFMIHGTNQVTLIGNVAFDIVGHCFMLADSEGNTFTGNLGLGIKNMPREITDRLVQQSTTAASAISDNTAAVFWISNPRNYFVANIAAGSEKFGIWFDCLGATQFMALGGFENNEIHSSLSSAFTTHFPGYQPQETAYFTNLKSYRNNGYGVFLHLSQNLAFVGGVLADNGSRAVSTSRADNVVFDGTRITGFSGTTEPWLLCSIGWNILGVLLDGTKWNEIDYAAKFVGSTLLGVEFAKWGADETGCGPRTTAIEVTKIQAFYPAFYNPNSISDAIVIGDANTLVEGCAAIDYGIDTVSIEVASDIHNAFSSNGSPGFVVSQKISNFVGGCSFYNKCLDFCPNACLRIVRVLTDAAAPEDIEMVVTNELGNTLTIQRDLRLHATDNALYPGIYVVALPAGSFEISFMDASGEDAYPGFVTPVFEAAPKCSGYVTLKDIKSVQPGYGREVCNDLIFNGNFDTDLSGWQSWLAFPYWTAHGGVDSGGALQTTNRGTATMVRNPQQWIDTSCIEPGKDYLLHFEYRNVDSAVPCQGSWDDCPNVQLSFEDFDPTTGDFVETLPRHEYGTTEPSADGTTFSIIEATWTPTEAEASADRVQIHIRFGSGEIIIDNVHLMKLWGSIKTKNGGFHHGIIDQGWHGWGNPIAIRQPGYRDADGYALAATISDSHRHGMWRDIVHRPWTNPGIDYIKAGDTWRIRFKTRLINSTTGAGVDCHPSLTNTGCPRAWIQTIPRYGQSTTQDVYDRDMSWDKDGWNTFDVTIRITAEQADNLKIFRLLLVGGPVGSLLINDEISFSKRLVSTRLEVCGGNHIVNGDFSAGASNRWSGWGHHIQVVQPGHDGSNDYALEAIRPAVDGWFTAGMYQDIFSEWRNAPFLTKCVKPGDVWRVKFKTRLIDPTNQAGIDCDPSLADKTCPMLQVHTNRGGVFLQTNVHDTNMVWDPNGWNTFDTTFTITESQAGDDLVLFRFLFCGGPFGALLMSDDFSVEMESAADSQFISNVS